jgi:hypothetical protein
MHISFKSRSLADLCNSGAALKRRWGTSKSVAIRAALTMLSDLPNLGFVRSCPGFLEDPVKTAQDGCFRMNAYRNCELLLQPNHTPVPTASNGNLACDKVTALILLEVNGYGA